MYQRTRIILDWTIAISVYSLLLLIIPFSNKLLVSLNADTVDVILNMIINLLIAAVFICLLIYLIARGKESAASSYIWLGVFFIVSMFFLMNVKVTTDRLHFLGYGILSLFVYRALRHNIGTQILYGWSSLFIMFFAVLDEMLQISGLGGRGFEIKDVGIDWLSGLTGQFLIALVVRPKLEAVNIKIRRYVEELKKIKTYKDARMPKAQRCNLKKIAKQICFAFKRNTGHNGGHVHFKYKGKQDHLVLICHNRKLEQIVVKNKNCKKGEYVEWNQSEFSDLLPKIAFLKLLPSIDNIIIDHTSFQKSWPCFDEFQSWLNTIPAC
ncbi:MAG: VanZ family protein [Candidatus Omnitrophica bacterium]|nr:VanZ family protein [Candidatus Omnitrophota bacterium]